MNKLGAIRYKLKIKLYNEFLDGLLEESGDATSFTVGKDKETWEFWINSSIEKVLVSKSQSLTVSQSHSLLTVEFPMDMIDQIGGWKPLSLIENN